MGLIFFFFFFFKKKHHFSTTAGIKVLQPAQGCAMCRATGVAVLHAEDRRWVV
jgi:hypothetical protein